MCDFNQGLSFGEALLRLHALDDQGLSWFEEPIVYDNLEGCAQLAREMKTPLQIGENIYGPRGFYKAVMALVQVAAYRRLRASWVRSAPNCGGGIRGSAAR